MKYFLTICIFVFSLQALAVNNQSSGNFSDFEPIFKVSADKDKKDKIKNFKRAIQDSLYAFLNREIYTFGSSTSKSVSIIELLTRLDKIEFIAVDWLVKPLGASRFSGFSDPFHQRIYVNVSDTMMSALIRPIALHEFFGAVGVEDGDYQLSLLIDAYINLSGASSTSVRPDSSMSYSFDGRVIVLSLIRDAIDLHIQKNFNKFTVLKMTDANNRILLPDGGSGVGSGGDTKDIYFKQSLLSYFLNNYRGSLIKKTQDFSAFILDIVNIKVRIDAGLPSEQPRYFLSAGANKMLSAVYLPSLGLNYLLALQSSSSYVTSVWDRIVEPDRSDYIDVHCRLLQMNHFFGEVVVPSKENSPDILEKEELDAAKKIIQNVETEVNSLHKKCELK